MGDMPGWRARGSLSSVTGRRKGAPHWYGGHRPLGDATSGPVRLWFNPQLRVEFHGATVISDAGLLLPRELDERRGLSAVMDRHLSGPRTSRNSQFVSDQL
jgi:hypothetical protein